MNTITIIQRALTILVIITILLQKKGAGLGGAVGGGSESASFSTRRGTENTVFKASIILAILFFAVSIARLLL